MTTILHTGNEVENAIHRFEMARISRHGEATRPSIVVKGEAVVVAAAASSPRTRTIAKYRNGLSEQEIERLSLAGHYMRGFGTPIWVVTEAHDEDEATARQLFSKVKNHVVRVQSDFRERLDKPVPGYWAEVLESKCSVHQNLITVVPVGRFAREIMERLKSSRLYGDNLKAKPIYDMNNLVRYLSKEATTQAHYKFGRSFPRLKGSHPLGAGGGDRVRLSEALEADMIRDGLIEPFRKTYVSRALSRPSVSANAPIPETITPDPNGLFGPLLEIEAPSRDHVLPARPRPKLVVYDQLELKLERLPDAIDLMGRLGATDAEIAARIGRSRPQTTNIRNRQFGASRQVVRRVLELALAA